MYTYQFRYRDSWEWLSGLITDQTLQSDIHYYPSVKFHVKNGVETRLYDEPWTGTKWWDVQVRRAFVNE